MFTETNTLLSSRSAQDRENLGPGPGMLQMLIHPFHSIFHLPSWPSGLFMTRLCSVEE